MNPSLDNQVAALKAAHRRQVRRLVAIRSLWVVLLIGLVLLYGDVFLQFNDPTRLGLDLGFLVGGILVAVLTRQRLVRARSEERRVARLIEEGNPDLANDLVNAIDFQQTLRRAGSSTASTGLMERHIALAAGRVRALARWDALRPPALRREGLVLLGLVAGLGLLLLLFSRQFHEVLPRYLDPFGDHPPYSPTRLSVEPAGATVEYGQSLQVSVTAAGPRPASVSLVLQDRDGRERAALPMLEGADGRYLQTLEDLRDDAVYSVRIPAGRSRRYSLAVIKWPKVQSATVAYEYPAYTRLAPETRYLNDRIVKGYAGTRATLTLLSNRPLRGGTLSVCGREYPLDLNGTNGVAASFNIVSNGVFAASIVDRDGVPTREPLQGTVEVVPDLKPDIVVVSPGMDSFATPDAQVPINVEARDDLGIARVELVRSRAGAADERRTIHTGDGRERFVNEIETLDLAALGAKVGDTIDYYATATDTAPNPPQTAATPAYRLTVISKDQYRELVQAETRAEDLTRKYDELMEPLNRLAARQSALEKQVSQLKSNLEQKAGPADGDRQRLEEALAAQKALAQETAKFARDLADEAKRPPLFDVEKEYKQSLDDLSKRMDQAKDAMTRGSGHLDQAAARPAARDGLTDLESALREQREALERLGQTRDDYDQGVRRASRDLEKVARLLEDAETFKALLERQTSLERQARTFKDAADPGLDERVRLKEVAGQQAEVRQALSRLKDNFVEHAKEIEADFPKVNADARKIAGEIRRRGIEDLMDSAVTRLEWADARGGHEKTENARQEMQDMVQVCQNAANDAQVEGDLRLKLTMNGGLGNTLQQLAGGLKAAAAARTPGASGKSGSGNGQSQFAVFGPDAPRPNQLSKGGGRSSHKFQAAPETPDAVAASFEEVAASKGAPMELPGGGGERILEEYRPLIQEYFKRVAEENQEKGGRP